LAGFCETGTSALDVWQGRRPPGISRHRLAGLSVADSEEKRKQFPENFVRFLGYTIYNARKYSRGKEWDLAQAHYNFARQIPSTIKQYINEDIRKNLSEEMINSPIGGICVMHTHNTLPSMAQKYRNPMWKIPTIELDPEDSAPVTGNRIAYLATQENYKKFAEDLLKRINTL